MQWKVYGIVLCLALAGFLSQAQPDFYRSINNENYWKNRSPYPGYWQQDVSYYIKAKIDEQANLIDGFLELTYWNNSPDTLLYVYFHLYQNAFQPGSHLDDLLKNNGVKPRYGKYETEKLGTVIEEMTVQYDEPGSNTVPSLTLDNTILRVDLKKPLLPDSKLRFLIKFKTYFDAGYQRRRMKMFSASGWKHFDGVHWYPRISVYDKKFGWDTNQHLGREFYGDYGTFDVELDFANYYVVDATGELQNQQEVMPDSLRKKLDIKNFKDKPFGEKASIIIQPDETRKVWKYHAVNVHDFAWTADPTYRIGEASWNGIKCIALAQEPVASRWQNAAEYTAKIIRLYSEDIGMYAYPKMIVADARDGMEYPMLTLDGGSDPGYRSLFCHEVGHNWFFGMVGNNETYRALMDEGFTQFIQTYALTKIEGIYPYIDHDKQKWYDRTFRDSVTFRFGESYYSYLTSAIRYDDGVINTHSDMFNGALGHGGGYGMVYRKTSTMLYNLQYVLGDDLFLKAMQHYFNQWKFCHPYIEDFRQSIIGYTKVDLNWFFDQWLDTDKNIDYKISSVKKGINKDDYTVQFRRFGRMQMPIDFTVFSNSGKSYNFHIPNTWFIKNTDATVLPKWYGWDKLHPSYSATIHIPDGIDNIKIDTSLRLADINMLNNSKKFPIKVRFDSRIYNRPLWDQYELKVRPDIWYNSYDGIKTGIHLEGNYFNYQHIFAISGWLNTAIAQSQLEAPVEINKHDQFSFIAAYETPLDKLINNTTIKLKACELDGLSSYSVFLEKLSNSKSLLFYTGYKSMIRHTSNDLDYLLYPGEWISSYWNNSLKSGMTFYYSKRNYYGQINLELAGSSLWSDYNFSSLILKNIDHWTTGKLTWHTRTFFQYTTGTDIANESALFLAGSNPEEMMDNKFLRARGFVPDEWLDYNASTNHLHNGGGLNLRGFAGYLVPYNYSNATQHYLYKGSSGASISIECDLNRLIDFKPSFTRNWLGLCPYLFVDAGVINTNAIDDDLLLSDLKSDAGVGIALTIKKWGPLETAPPFTIRADFPLLLNPTPAEEKDNFKFRWLIGISRSF